MNADRELGKSAQQRAGAEPGGRAWRIVEIAFFVLSLLLEPLVWFIVSLLVVGVTALWDAGTSTLWWLIPSVSNRM